MHILSIDSFDFAKIFRQNAIQILEKRCLSPIYSPKSYTEHAYPSILRKSFNNELTAARTAIPVLVVASLRLVRVILVQSLCQLTRICLAGFSVSSHLVRF
jgi:hypothetical protein